MSERTVYVRSTAGGSVSVFHTEEDCPGIAKAKNVRECDRDVVEARGLDECSKCNGTEHDDREYDLETERRFYDLAREANPDDIFATDGGDA